METREAAKTVRAKWGSSLFAPLEQGPSSAGEPTVPAGEGVGVEDEVFKVQDNAHNSQPANMAKGT